MVLRILAVALPLLLLSACQTLPEGHAGAAVIDVGSAERPQARGAEAMPAAVESSRVNIGAVQGLIAEARQFLSEERWWSAVDVAERGVRIEPREPQLYSILVKAYLGLGEPGLAQKFARQGVRFCDQASESCGFLRQNLVD